MTQAIEALRGENRPPEQVMIENGVAALLPYAAGTGLATGFDTPLRWHESFYDGEPPFSLDLWANLTPDRLHHLSIVRQLTHDKHYRERRDDEDVWLCVVRKPLPDDETSDYARTAVSVTEQGQVRVSRDTYRRRRKDDPADIGTCTGVEIDGSLTPQRRAELLAELSETVICAATALPDVQRCYQADRGCAPAYRPFARYGAYNSLKAVGYLLVSSAS